MVQLSVEMHAHLRNLSHQEPLLVACSGQPCCTSSPISESHQPSTPRPACLSTHQPPRSARDAFTVESGRGVASCTCMLAPKDSTKSNQTGEGRRTLMLGHLPLLPAVLVVDNNPAILLTPPHPQPGSWQLGVGSLAKLTDGDLSHSWSRAQTRFFAYPLPQNFLSSL